MPIGHSGVAEVYLHPH